MINYIYPLYLFHILYKINIIKVFLCWRIKMIYEIQKKKEKEID